MAETGIDRYDELHAGFRWQVPARFNIAEVCCTRWARATPEAIAIRYQREDGSRPRLQLRRARPRRRPLAAALRALGVGRGERVAIVMPQRFETAVAHIALYRLGAVAMPLSMLFGPDALEYRINDSGARLAWSTRPASTTCSKRGRLCPAARDAGSVGGAEAAAMSTGRPCWTAAGEPPNPVDTAADDACVLIYTSGTTGPPKGALLPHRVLIGNLPGFVCSQNWFPQDDAVFWSPADWAWTGGLMDALLPTLYFGREIVAYQGRFAPETAFRCWRRTGSRTAFSFPPRSRR
jgi:acetyl-CoA synthetase